MLGRIFQVLLIACLATSPLRAETDPLVGQWKLISLTDQFKVTHVDANRYAFNFGGGVETIAVDGTQQPGSAGTTLSVAPDGPNWKVVRKKDGRVLLTARWSLSKDGNSLIDDFTSFSKDGSPSNVKFVYARKAAGSGFAGTWLSTTAANNSVIMLQVRPYDGDGLSFIIPSGSQTLNVRFDGRDYSNAPGSVSSARRLNARTVEIFRKSKGKITQTQQITVAPDLKTLTILVRVVGMDEPYTRVFERQ